MLRQFAAPQRAAAAAASAAVWPKLFSFFSCHLIAKSFRNKLGLFLLGSHVTATQGVPPLVLWPTREKLRIDRIDQNACVLG